MVAWACERLSGRPQVPRGASGSRAIERAGAPPRSGRWGHPRGVNGPLAIQPRDTADQPATTCCVNPANVR